ncbi:hypothetical protein, partial [uncultured Desulfovibrio sp.]|uniref:hypothetical protein n=1 Tax=uncultured Desulfovibrio sp. TaxID=167968 RepID=UPI00266EF146
MFRWLLVWLRVKGFCSKEEVFRGFPVPFRMGGRERHGNFFTCSYIFVYINRPLADKQGISWNGIRLRVRPLPFFQCAGPLYRAGHPAESISLLFKAFRFFSLAPGVPRAHAFLIAMRVPKLKI